MNTIRAKLFLSFGILAVMALGMAGAALRIASNDAARMQSIVDDRVVALDQLKIAADSYAVGVVDAAHKARNGQYRFPEAAEQIRASSKKADEAWTAYVANQSSPREKELQRTAEAQRAVAKRAIGELLAALDARDEEALQTFIRNKLYQTIDPISTSVGELAALQIALAKDDTAEASRQSNTMMGVIGGLTLVVLLGIVGAILYVARGVLRPLDGLRAAMSRLALGGTLDDVPGQGRSDEIGGMAGSVVSFHDAAIAQRAAAEAKAKADAEQARVVETVGAHLSKLAGGDLTASIDAPFDPAYEALRTSFNDALDSLRDLLGSVARSTAQIRTGSQEIAQAAEDLARRTEGNAASLEQTSAAMAQVDGRIRATAEAASTTVDRADQASSTVNNGRTMAEQAVGWMKRVAESAKGIDDVIEGLDKIAFQTRVLAMNAAVEAGRAGEAGRGFAVVADLVSALAMRAEEEAKRARDQLTATQTDIAHGVSAVERVDEALANISSDVAEVQELVGRIATDNKAQVTAASEITAAVLNMDRATQQNAAMVEQTSAAARNLSIEVESLAEQARRFDTGSGGGDRSAGAASAQTVTEPARVAGVVPPATPSRPSRPASRAPSRERAPKPGPKVSEVRIAAATEDDWASF